MVHLQRHDPAVQQFGRRATLATEVVHDQDAAIGFQLHRRLVEPAVFRAGHEIEIFDGEFAADHDQGRADLHPALIVVIGGGLQTFVVVMVEDLDDLAIHLDGVGDPEMAGDGADQGVGDGGFAVTGGTAEEQTATGTGDQAEGLLGGVGEHQVFHGIVESVLVDQGAAANLLAEHVRVAGERDRGGADITVGAADAGHGIPATVKHGVAVVVGGHYPADFE